MATATRRLVVDVFRQTTFSTLYAKQGDVNGRLLNVELQNNGTKITISQNAIVVLDFRRPDGEAKGFAGSVNSDGTVTVTLTSWCMEVFGKALASVSIIENNTKLTTLHWKMQIEPSEYNGDDITEDENYDILVTLIDRVQEEVPASVTAWLNEHVQTGYAVDNTLTISGAAADAKVTGDTFAGELESELKRIALAAYATDTTSGSVASFTDGAEDVPVKELKVNIEPVQDLNGQSSPYPAGGGVNKFAVNESATSSDVISSASASTGVIGIADTTAIKWVTPYIGYTDIVSGKTYTISGGVLKYGRIGASTTTSQPSSSNVPDTSIGATIQSAISNVIASRTFTANATQRIYWFYCTDAGNANHQAFNVQPVIVEGSSAGTWSPYENICSISGHTEVNVYRTGKNLWHTDFTNSGGGLTKRDGEMEVNVPSDTSTTYLLGGSAAGNLIGYKLKSGTYTLSAHSTDFSGIYVTLSDGSTWANGETKTFLSDAIINNVRCTGKTLTAGTYTLHWQLQIELGSTATAYEPYAGATYHTDLGQTVYGGTLNVPTGVLTVTQAMKTVGEMNWTNNTNAHVFLTANAIGKKAGYLTMISEQYTPTNAALSAMPDYSIRGHANNATSVYVKDPRYSTYTEFVEAQGDSKIVYELATPITVQLTPSQVSTLLGQNSIWVDAGEVSVVYRADTGLYIDKMIANAMNA